jgi:hypothetical protein
MMNNESDTVYIYYHTAVRNTIKIYNSQILYKDKLIVKKLEFIMINAKGGSEKLIYA